MKPLFVPFKKEWFKLFECHDKTTEYRVYGPRWNERTCTVGREVTLSCGYSGKRLHRTVSRFEKLKASDAPQIARDIFPQAEFIAAIGIAP